MDTRGPHRHKRDTVRRFSTAANPWGDDDQKRTPEPLREQHMGTRGTSLVIHARRNHPLTLKTPSSPASSPAISPPAGPGYTLPELLLLLVDSEESKRESVQNAFLLLHQLFVASLKLLELLAGLYKQQSTCVTQMKVVAIIQKWLKLYPEDFVDMKMRFKLRALILEMVNSLSLAREFDSLREELRATLRLSEQAHVAIRPPSYYIDQNVKQIEAARAKDALVITRPKTRESPENRSSSERARSVAPRRTNTDRSLLPGLERVQSNGSSELEPEYGVKPDRENGRTTTSEMMLGRVCSNDNLALLLGNTTSLERARSSGQNNNSSTSKDKMNGHESGVMKINGSLEEQMQTNHQSFFAGIQPSPFERGSIHQTLKEQHYDPFSDAQNDHDEEDGPDEAVSSLASPRSPVYISEPKTLGGGHWKGSDFLLDLSPAKVCAALTVLDHINLRAIKLRELSNKQWTRPDALTKAPNVVAMVDQYNARSYWVAAEILLLHSQEKRVKAIRFFIDLAQECAHVKNYFSVFSIIHGLNQSPLFRLQADWEKLPRASKACLSALKSTITEPSNNFKVYKAIKHQAQIPHLAYYTKLCFVFAELPLYLGAEQRINWDKKIFAIHNVLEEFQSCQKQELKIGQDVALLELLGRLTRAVHYAATSIKFDAMWTLSFQYLPKPGRDANVIPLDNQPNTAQRAVPPTS